MRYKCRYNSPIGEIIMVSDGKYLTNLWIEGQPGISGDFKEKDLEIFFKTKKWLDDYFAGKEPKIGIPIKLEGTEFRKEVWEILLKIPYGQTITYTEIAQKIAKNRKIKRMSAQALEIILFLLLYHAIELLEVMAALLDIQVDYH